MELLTPATSDPPAPPPTSPPPLRRKGTAVGLLLTRTETVENPCIPMFYFMLGGVLPIGQVRERVWDAIKKFDRFRSILEGDDFVADDDAFRIEDHVRELTAEEFGAPSIAQSDMGTLRRFLEKRFSAPLDTEDLMPEAFGKTWCVQLFLHTREARVRG